MTTRDGKDAAHSNPVKVLDLPAEYAARRAEYDAAMAGVLETGAFVLGPDMKALEAELAAYAGVGHGVACGNGTDALRIALQAMGVGCGDEVIIPAFTFFATFEAVLHVNATPVCVDIQAGTFNIDPEAVTAAVTDKTRAVIAVSLFGQLADIVAVESAASEAAGRPIPVLEDSAQSFGASRGGVKSGAWGAASATSFFPTKPLGAFGDGGCCLTDDADMAGRMRRLRHHGDAGRYDHHDIGWNSRLDTIQAAILRVKLRYLDTDLDGRRRVAAAYDESLAGLAGLTPPQIQDACVSVYAQYAVRIDGSALDGGGRDAVQAALKERGIPSSVHYPLAVYEQPAVRKLNLPNVRRCPEAERAAREVLCLPIYPAMPAADVDRVVAALRDVLGESTAEPQVRTAAISHMLDRHHSASEARPLVVDS